MRLFSLTIVGLLLVCMVYSIQIQTNLQGQNIFKKIKHSVKKAADKVVKTADTVVKTATAVVAVVETDAEHLESVTAKLEKLSAATITANVNLAVAEANKNKPALIAAAKAASDKAYKSAVAAGQSVMDFWDGIQCTVCKAAAEILIVLAEHGTCATLDPLIDLACLEAGAGPEDPFADGCAVLFDGFCEIILAEISFGTAAADRICEDVKAC